jgi:hypothetical protein
MKPIGLILKNVELNVFTGRTSGELMLIHQCLSCGKISPNRIAGDDNPYEVVSLLKNVSQTIKFSNMKLLTSEDKSDVLRILFGKSSLRKL